MEIEMALRSFRFTRCSLGGLEKEVDGAAFCGQTTLSLDKSLLNRLQIFVLQVHAKSPRTIFPLERRVLQQTVDFFREKQKSTFLLTSFILSSLPHFSLSLSPKILFPNSSSKVLPLKALYYPFYRLHCDISKLNKL